MSDHKITFSLNGKVHQCSSEKARQPLSTYLREQAHLKGTKIVCAEGDCGACTVALKMPHEEKFRGINSCIATLATLDGSQIISVEGLSGSREPNEVAQSFMKYHGAQCGFCTPGFICSLTTLFNDQKSKSIQKIKNATTGNLCRCTGYLPIIQAGENLDPKKITPLEKVYSTDELNKRIQRGSDLVFKNKNFHFYAPTTLKTALELKNEQNDLKVISGMTDLGVLTNKNKIHLEKCLSLQNISEMFEVKHESNHIFIGAKVILDVVENELEKTHLEFSKMLQIFASPQIKNRATLVGNIANGSPIADGIPFLMAMNAKIELSSLSGKREVNINDFYKGYRQLDINQNEIITGIVLPYLKEEEKVKLYKVSVRKDMDISAVTFALKYSLNDNTFTDAHLVYGGVGPVVQTIKKANDFLKDKKLSVETMDKVKEIVQQEVHPIGDVRGSEKFRRIICNNLIDKFYNEVSI